MTLTTILKVRSHLVAILAALVTLAPPVRAQDVAIVAGTVTNAVTGAPIANARLTVAGETRPYVTAGDGKYRLTVSVLRANIRATAFGFAPDSESVSVSAGTTTIVSFALHPNAAFLDKVTSLGTRARERSALESAVPVDVISSELMETTGAVETWQQLQRLVPSAFAPHIPLGDNGMRPITLRGLAPHHTLVLVNGKRRHPSAALLAGPSVPNTGFTDLNAIPSSAIDHVEVLRDGASAQYGSDAIGGVVNVVLKSGATRDLRTSVGSVLSSEGARHFRDGRLLDVTGTYGVIAKGGAQLTLSGQFRERGGTNRAYPDKRQQYFAGDVRNGEPPRISSYLGDGALRDVSFFANGILPLARTTEVYAFGGWATDRNLSPDAFFRRPLEQGTVRAIFPNGFLPRIESDIGNGSAAVGVRGYIRGWKWDLSSGWGTNRVLYHVRNSDNVSLGEATPTSFYVGRVAAQQMTSDLDVSREATIMSLPLTMAAGAGFRLDRYQIRAGEPDSWRNGGVRILDGPQAGQPSPVGAQGMLGFRPVDEVSPHRSNKAVYAEIDAQPSRRLLLQSAVRGEDYSDFGSTLDGKIAARLEPLAGVALRGSVSTGFRAPSLTEEYFSSSRTIFRQVGGVGNFLTSRTFPVSSAEARLMGSVPLRPEKSVNRSVGLVLKKYFLPALTADYYEISLADRITLTGVVSDTAIIRLFNESGLQGIGGGNYFANKLETRTRGIDVVASQVIPLADNKAASVLAGYNYNRTRVTRVYPAPVPLASFEPLLFSRTSRGVIEQGQPRQTISVDLHYSSGPLGLNVDNQRSGPTAQLDQTTAAADQHVVAKWITDVRASYELRNRVQVAVSLVNVFDVYPNEWWDFKDGVNAKAFSNGGIFRYPGALSAVGMNGRTVYLQLTYR